jgi:hypothetical protein
MKHLLKLGHTSRQTFQSVAVVSLRPLCHHVHNTMEFGFWPARGSIIPLYARVARKSLVALVAQAIGVIRSGSMG